MDALEAIRRRRSIRKYKTDPVPRKDLETIVDAGRLAATGYNRQPWEFIVVTDPATIQRLDAEAHWVRRVPAVIAVVLDTSAEYWHEDGAAATENLLIAATALGYGSCWLEGYTIPREESLKAVLGIPPARKLLTLVTVGMAAEAPTKQKKPLSQVIRWETY